MVELGGSEERWKVEVEEEEWLEKPVDREDRDDLDGEKLENRENGEDDPVGQPLGIVFLVARLNGLDAGKIIITNSDNGAFSYLM